ncbi:MAG: indolepyruvate oxidoreductase subunit beta [Dehalococcoidia bacterium]|nr:MAG: indolepyruvate oxidoreductase subunit beta [Dehalococcoidia bacterium]UCG82333.1 MAG: indolepyruvate oxidoreductase subunit beta [Dehalococcoidia bacterium]
MNDVNVLMVGVGGHGVILASDGMSEIGMNNGYDVKKTDSLGMAQRGGSVVSHVRWGKHVFSPMIKKGEVDYLLGFEQLEAARWASYLKPNGVAIVADVVVIPISAIDGKIPYPDWKEVKGILAQYTDQIYLIPATRIAEEVENPRAVNMAMLGFLSAFLELEPQAWTETMRHRLPAKFMESSIEAFTKGASEAKSMIPAKGN